MASASSQDLYGRGWKPRFTRWDRVPEETRFWLMVQKTETCWLWMGYCDKGGYGHFAETGPKKDRGAHRFAYELSKGPIPEGLAIDHLCRVRNCVNPAHLEAVTDRENLLRGDTAAARKAAQTHCIHGHELTPANTYHHGKNGRKCKPCSKRRDGERTQRLKRGRE